MLNINQNSYLHSFSVARTAENIGIEIARMSSGERIQRASDDVSSLAIGTKMKIRSASLRVVMDSMQQAVSLLQIADKGLSQIQDILQRMSTVAMQSNSGAVTAQERLYLNQEFQQLKLEIDRIAENNNFNGQHLLNGEMVLKPFPMEFTDFVTEENITGTVDSDILNGGEVNSLITGLDGDDILNGVSGNNIFQSGVGVVTGATGTIYQSPSPINNLTQAENVVATQPVWATFLATSLDYPFVGNSATSNINNFLSGDIGSLTPAGLGGTLVNQMVFVFEGKITIPNDGNYTFSVGSDDGFNLRIGGNTIIQFTNNRGFGFTTGNAFLSAGEHNFRLLYWENGGGEGVLARSNIDGAGLQVLDVDNLFYDSSASDGNDILNGTEQGVDIAVYSGSQSDYTITQISDKQFIVQDNRVNSPNGTDVLNDINIIRFSDGEINIIPDVAKEVRKTIDYIISETGAELFSYEVVDVRTSELFLDSQNINISTSDDAINAFNEVIMAINVVTGKRSYIGAKMQQAGVIFAHSLDNFREKNNAKSALLDTDITKSSSKYAELVAKYQFDVLLKAQAMQLKKDTIITLLENNVSEVASLEQASLEAQ